MKNKFYAVMAWFTALIMSHGTVVAHAGGLTVETDGEGITIAPGQYPSLKGDLDSTVEEANNVLDRYRVIGNFIIAIIILLLLGLLILHITNFAKAGDNEQDRKKAMSGMLFCGMAIAIIGSLSLVVAFVQNLL